MTDSQTPDWADRLNGLASERGYLLPHHGLLAVALPDLLEDYDGLYQSAASRPRHLDVRTREAVWLAVLASSDEGLGTHHVARFLEQGGTCDHMARLLGIAALARGAGALEFAQECWTVHAPELAPATAWRAAVQVTGNDLPETWIHLAALAALACTGHHQALCWQFEAAYAAGTDERGMAEALSIMMLPGGVPRFARACGVWLELIRSGRIEASEPFQAWADLEGQGGYDETVGRTRKDPLSD